MKNKLERVKALLRGISVKYEVRAYYNSKELYLNYGDVVRNRVLFEDGKNESEQSAMETEEHLEQT